MLATLALLYRAALTYRNVLAETEALFDYQLRQMALSLRDQGEIAPAQANSLADEQLDFVVQIWSADGRSIYPPRLRSTASPTRGAWLGADITVSGKTWRTSASPPAAASSRSHSRCRSARSSRPMRRCAASRRGCSIAPRWRCVIWWLAGATSRRCADCRTAARARAEQSLATAAGGRRLASTRSRRWCGALKNGVARYASVQSPRRAAPFVADAAHELRSPSIALTLQMRLLLERARRGARGRRRSGARRPASTAHGWLVEQLRRWRAPSQVRHDPRAWPRS